jgi:hypothetical protein
MIGLMAQGKPKCKQDGKARIPFSPVDDDYKNIEEMKGNNK